MKSRRFVIPILLVVAVALLTLWFKARVDKLHGPGSPESFSGFNSGQQPGVENFETADIQTVSNISTEIMGQYEMEKSRLKQPMVGRPEAAANVPAPVAPAVSVASSTPPPPETLPSPPPTTINMTNAPVIPPGQGRPFSGP